MDHNNVITKTLKKGQTRLGRLKRNEDGLRTPGALAELSLDDLTQFEKTLRDTRKPQRRFLISFVKMLQNLKKMKVERIR